MKRFWLLIAALVLGVVFANVLFFTFGDPSEEPTPFQASSLEEDSRNELPPATQDSQNSTSTSDSLETASGGGGGGGSSGGGSSSSEESLTCVSRQMSYSLTGPTILETCLAEDPPGTCISKQFNCSLEIKNLETEYAGEFIFSLNYSLLNSTQLSFETISHTLVAEESKYFSLLLVRNGAAATESVDCSHATEQIPQKEICS